MSREEEGARHVIAKLVSGYESLNEREIKKYTEADTRRVFIMPLFRSLGWDVYGRQEVREEERASRGRVDYAFCIREIPKFFLEAKALRADLDNPEFAKQAINYAYHKGATWAVLTDFERLKVFNAEVKEAKVSQALFFELKCNEYLNRFDQLSLLSREAFEQGTLDKKALKWGKRIRKTPVGQQLFSDLVYWRALLHKYLSSYNKKQQPHLVDEAVQRILDRLIFIRTCEDRGIEPPTLRPLVRQCRDDAGKDFTRELKHIWEDFDAGYDSRLFQHHLADQLECESTPFVEAIEGLYATPDRSIEYDFNAIDADVLGGIYEQYLEHLLKGAGKKIEIGSERRKRKAQGIYYTPKFVVRYIVENTLGQALEAKSLREARKLRILDPACGSGSFLVEALDYLERHWQRQNWTQQPRTKEDARPADFFDYVTRVQFLTENLYGVDLDAQAVEIAQLNLLLRCLHQRALLPDLINNIREGNSLISGSEEGLRSYFGDAWLDKKPFNWEERFDEVMREGGFDVIIGNPPYLNIKLMSDDEKDFYRHGFSSAMASFDMYVLFIEKGLRLLRPGGRLGFIIPNKFIHTGYAAALRELLSKEATLETIVDFGDHPVFQDSTTYPCILIAQKGRATGTDLHYIRVKQMPIDLVQMSARSASSEHSDDDVEITTVGQESLTQSEWCFRPSVELDIIDKVQACSVSLESLVEKIFVGLQITPADVLAVSIVSKAGNDSRTESKLVEVTSKALGNKRVLLERDLLRPLIKSSDISQYSVSHTGTYVVFPYEIRREGKNRKAILIDPRTMQSRYRHTFAYLAANRSRFEARDRGAWRGSDEWYAYSRRQNLECHNQAKIVTPNISRSCHFAWDRGRYYLDRGSFGILPTKGGMRHEYLLGILNSAMGDYYVKATSPYISGGYYSFTTSYLNPFPIRRIDFADPSDRMLHDNLVTLISRRLELSGCLASVRDTPCNKRDALTREAEQTDRKIDDLVYDLYGLTDEERRIVEERS
jgi:type I restriction-modification system DNA methylase subunit